MINTGILREGMRIRSLSGSWEGVVEFVNESRARVKAIEKQEVDKDGEIIKVIKPSYFSISPTAEVEICN